GATRKAGRTNEFRAPLCVVCPSKLGQTANRGVAESAVASENCAACARLLHPNVELRRTRWQLEDRRFFTGCELRRLALSVDLDEQHARLGVSSAHAHFVLACLCDFDAPGGRPAAGVGRVLVAAEDCGIL